MVERVNTGIPGFDELVQGGFPEGSVVLLTGGPGTGKTTFCSQFLWTGLQQGERCLYITTEELPDEIKQDASQFGWDFAQFEPEQYKIKNMEPSDKTEYLPQNIRQIGYNEGYDRIVLDSISVFGIYWRGKKQVRRNMSDLIKEFRKMDSTVLMTAEKGSEGDGYLSREGVAEYISDGVIDIDVTSMGSGLERTINVMKMRTTDMDGGIRDLRFNENGLYVE